MRNICTTLLGGLVITALAGCSAGSTKSPDVSDRIRKDLDQASFKDVSVNQDRDKGVVTLSGHVASEDSIAKADAPGQVMADEIGVVPPYDSSTAKEVNSDLDKGIDKNLDAALAGAKLKNVDHSVKNGVVTLKGDVNSQTTRARAERIASKVPNVQQVVNELEVKNQKATSTK
jgi:hyperosmotically inducible protein